MKRRSKAGGAPIKGRRRKAPKPEHRNAPKTALRSKSSPSSEDTAVARLTHELRETTEQHTATSEILRVISSSPSDLQPVFQAMLKNAVRLCDAKFGNIYRWDGDALHLVATQNVPAAFVQARGRSPLRPSPPTPTGRMIATKTVVNVADMRAEKAYADRDPYIVAGVELGGVRSALVVPMLKDYELIGSFSVYRQEVRAFTDKQIALVQNFASQAVIAIENARLLNELRQRTADLSERTSELTEALEQQTATSEVLQVISSFPGDLHPVFATILENSTRICEANFGNFYLWDGDAFHLVAAHNTPRAFGDIRKRAPFRPNKGHPFRSLAETKQMFHVADIMTLPIYQEGDPQIVEAVELGKMRTCLGVPMLKDDNLIGAVLVFRQEVRQFTANQIALITNFAAQAIIAIENARLLKELRERTEQVEAQSQELVKLNQHLEQRVTDQVDEIERMSRLRRFLPSQVADLIVASGAEKQLESHRREITALFCDLRGFTGFTESADAEDVMALLRDYHAAIGEIIIKYNGTLERYAGDGVMVVFNDPVPVENPALQAVLMALEVRDAIGALTETWRRWGHDIGFGIGIAHGFATLGATGATLLTPCHLSNLAKAYAGVGQFDRACRCIGEAMTVVDTTKESWCEAEINRMAGEIALMSPQPDAAKAEAHFERALAVSRQQQAKSWELRAAMSLARLWRDQGKVQQARELLAPVYGWFTEGFDTRDLKEAKKLLEELVA